LRDITSLAERKPFVVVMQMSKQWHLESLAYDDDPNT